MMFCNTLSTELGIMDFIITFVDTINNHLYAKNLTPG